MGKIDHLGNESMIKWFFLKCLIINYYYIYICKFQIEYLVLEQVCIAALDCDRHSLAEYCIKILKREFPSSLRVHKYHAMHLEALEM